MTLLLILSAWAGLCANAAGQSLPLAIGRFEGVDEAAVRPRVEAALSLLKGSAAARLQARRWRALGGGQLFVDVSSSLLKGAGCWVPGEDRLTISETLIGDDASMASNIAHEWAHAWAERELGPAARGMVETEAIARARGWRVWAELDRTDFIRGSGVGLYEEDTAAAVRAEMAKDPAYACQPSYRDLADPFPYYHDCLERMTALRDQLQQAADVPDSPDAAPSEVADHFAAPGEAVASSEGKDAVRRDLAAAKNTIRRAEVVLADPAALERLKKLGRSRRLKELTDSWDREVADALFLRHADLER